MTLPEDKGACENMPDDDGIPSSVLTLAEAASFIRVSTKTLREMNIVGTS